MKEDFSPEEWAARVDLAACYRLIDVFGMVDMIYNHISLAVPGEPGNFLINPFGLHYSEITASSLLKVDLQGNVLFNPWKEYSFNTAGFVIHSTIHAARKDARCIIHTHTPHGMAISALKCGLLPITQTAMRFGRVSYHDYMGVVIDDRERQSLVSDLGSSEVMILRNHGLLATGGGVPQAFNNIYRLERACRTQVLAMSCGSELIIPDTEVIAHTNDQLAFQPCDEKAEKPQPFGLLEWPALRRIVDRARPGYDA